MTYDKMIENIMREVQGNSADMFIVHRDKQGEFFCNFTHSQYNELFEWVEAVKARDPFAVEFMVSDFNGESYAYIHDRIFTERLRSEYEKANFHNADRDELSALMNFLEENIGKCSPRTMEYLALFDRPLAALYEMTPISLKSANPDFDYDDDKSQEFIDAVEAEVDKWLNNSRKQEIPKETEQREQIVINGYVEKHHIQIAGNLVILAENSNSDEPYMVCYRKTVDLFGIREYYNIVTTADYVEALKLYAGGIQSFVQTI